MVDRESIVPLGLGLAFAIVLHLAVVPLCAKVYSVEQVEKTEPKKLVEPAQQPEPEQLDKPGEMLPLRADLTVRSIQVPPVIFGDEPFELSYVASNLGGTPTPGNGWIDGIYLSQDEVLDKDDPPLTALNQSRSLAPMEHYRDGETRVKIPPGYVGDMFIIVKADSDNDVDESPKEDNNALAAAIHIIGDKDREELPLGKDDVDERLTVAWISYEDFVKMQAPEHEVIQPAVQTQADPVANAPIEYDPTQAPPTSPLKPQPAMQKAQQPAQVSKGDPAAQVKATSPDRKPQLLAKASKPNPSLQEIARKLAIALPLPGELPPVQEAAVGSPAMPRMVEAQTPDPNPAGRPANQEPGEAESLDDDTTSAHLGHERKDQPPRPPKRESRPTAVPRMHAQSPLFDKDESLKVRPGEVLTGNGIEIRTVLPKVGIVARSIIYPARNPKVAIRFNPQGHVIKATILESSGSSNWNTPIIASIYKWRAVGENLRKRHNAFEIEVTILITR